MKCRYCAAKLRNIPELYSCKCGMQRVCRDCIFKAHKDDCTHNFNAEFATKFMKAHNEEKNLGSTHRFNQMK